MTVGTLNRSGKTYVGHFDVTLKNRLSQLLDLTGPAMATVLQGQLQWVNGNDYTTLNEAFGMIKFDSTFITPLGMLPYHDRYAHEQQIHYRYIAERQGTMMAVLPVHTRAERDLFQLLTHSSPLFLQSNNQPNWSALAAVWAGHADGKNIFYKMPFHLIWLPLLHIQLNGLQQLPEHLKSYHKTWLDFHNEQNTIALNAEAAQRIRILVRAQPAGLNINAPTMLPATLRDSITAGATQVASAVHDLDSWQIGKLLGDHMLQQSAINYTYSNIMPRARAAGPSGSAKRKAPPDTSHDHDGVNDTNLNGNAGNRRLRRKRRCRKCQSMGCPGRWKIEKCVNAKNVGTTFPGTSNDGPDEDEPNSVDLY
ncbi:hypothetical protein APHAL10511_000833 [Amanita phalloides]|nr:hypothetical protein APHAL10511_000833 [Amanita phalloides]